MGHDQAYGIAMDSTAMYVVGFDASPAGDWRWRIEKRSLADGSLVPAFGTGGVVTSNPGTNYNEWDEAHSIAVDSTAMYVIGTDHSFGIFNEQWRIEKRLK